MLVTGLFLVTSMFASANTSLNPGVKMSMEEFKRTLSAAPAVCTNAQAGGCLDQLMGLDNKITCADLAAWLTKQDIHVSEDGKMVGVARIVDCATK